MSTASSTTVTLSTFTSPTTTTTTSTSVLDPTLFRSKDLHFKNPETPVNFRAPSSTTAAAGYTASTSSTISSRHSNDSNNLNATAANDAVVAAISRNSAYDHGTVDPKLDHSRSRNSSNIDGTAPSSPRKINSDLAASSTSNNSGSTSSNLPNVRSSLRILGSSASKTPVPSKTNDIGSPVSRSDNKDRSSGLRGGSSKTTHSSVNNEPIPGDICTTRSDVASFKKDITKEVEMLNVVDKCVAIEKLQRKLGKATDVDKVGKNGPLSPEPLGSPVGASGPPTKPLTLEDDSDETEEPTFMVHKGPNVKYHVMVHKDSDESLGLSKGGMTPRSGSFNSRPRTCKTDGKVRPISAGTSRSSRKSRPGGMFAPNPRETLDSNSSAAESQVNGSSVQQTDDSHHSDSQPSDQNFELLSPNTGTSTDTRLQNRSLTDLLSDVQNSKDSTIRSILADREFVPRSSESSDASNKSRKLVTSSSLRSKSYRTGVGGRPKPTEPLEKLPSSRSRSVDPSEKTISQSGSDVICASSSLVAKIMNSKLTSVNEAANTTEKSDYHVTNYRKMTVAVEKPPRKSRTVTPSPTRSGQKATPISSRFLSTASPKNGLPTVSESNGSDALVSSDLQPLDVSAVPSSNISVGKPFDTKLYRDQMESQKFGDFNAKPPRVTLKTSCSDSNVSVSYNAKNNIGVKTSAVARRLSKTSDDHSLNSSTSNNVSCTTLGSSINNVSSINLTSANDSPSLTYSSSSFKSINSNNVNVNAVTETNGEITGRKRIFHGAKNSQDSFSSHGGNSRDSSLGNNFKSDPKNLPKKNSLTSKNKSPLNSINSRNKSPVNNRTRSPYSRTKSPVSADSKLPGMYSARLQNSSNSYQSKVLTSPGLVNSTDSARAAGLNSNANGGRTRISAILRWFN